MSKELYYPFREMNIEMRNKKIASLFPQGTIVFKITSISLEPESEQQEIGIVTTKEDYEKKIRSHKYNPLLYIIPLPIRLAYLYDCLNRSYNISRKEKFVFWWRRMGTNRWHTWFIVHPYQDSKYGEKPKIILEVDKST